MDCRRYLSRERKIKFRNAIYLNLAKCNDWNVMLFAEKHFVERLAGRCRLLRILWFLYRLVKHEEVNSFYPHPHLWGALRGQKSTFDKVFFGEEHTYHQNDALLIDKSEGAFQILRNMSDDQNICYHCVMHHITNDHIKKILEIRSSNIEYQLKISNVRWILNLFGTFNVVLVFIVYGGPVIINCLTCINALFILIAPFVIHYHYVIYIESFAVIIATVITMQSFYSLIIAAIEIHIKRLTKKDE